MYNQTNPRACSVSLHTANEKDMTDKTVPLLRKTRHYYTVVVSLSSVMWPKGKVFGLEEGVFF